MLGAGVDGAVRRIGQSYEVRGLVEKVTSYSDASGTAVVNEVQNAYNSFSQLVTQYQEHSGSVNTGTTPKVEYGYADGSAVGERPADVEHIYDPFDQVAAERDLLTAAARPGEQHRRRQSMTRNPRLTGSLRPRAVPGWNG